MDNFELLYQMVMYSIKEVAYMPDCEELSIGEDHAESLYPFAWRIAHEVPNLITVEWIKSLKVLSPEDIEYIKGLQS